MRPSEFDGLLLAAITPPLSATGFLLTRRDYVAVFTRERVPDWIDVVEVEPKHRGGEGVFVRVEVGICVVPVAQLIGRVLGEDPATFRVHTSMVICREVCAREGECPSILANRPPDDWWFLPPHLDQTVTANFNRAVAERGLRWIEEFETIDDLVTRGTWGDQRWPVSEWERELLTVMPDWSLSIPRLSAGEHKLSRRIAEFLIKNPLGER